MFVRDLICHQSNRPQNPHSYRNMYPSESVLSPDRGHGGVCVPNSLSGTFCFQSSQPQLKRFIMVDQSGGKGRVFVHPSLAEELFPPLGQTLERTIGETERTGELRRDFSRAPDVEVANARLLAFRETVATAFTSLQRLRDIRRVDVSAPRAHAQQPPSAPATSSICLSGTKRVSGEASGSVREDTEDLDALLSSDDEDDEVVSTGHSPEEQSADESYGSEGEEQSSKRRRLEGEKGVRAEQHHSMEGRGKAMSSSRQKEQEGLARKLKIKRTVKTLRNMIPGGSCLDAALVLEETIFYVNILRDRINQLEATRFQKHPTI